MTIVYYSCGCWFSYSMFGDREPMGFSICAKHCTHPKVLECQVKNLHGEIRDLQEHEEKPDGDMAPVPSPTS